MTDYQILVDLGLVVVGSALLLVVSRPLRVPSILAYMVAGLLLGPISGLLPQSESVHLFSELGVALLLFVVGLELSLAKIRVIGRTALIAGLGQVGLTFGLGWALAWALGFEGGAAVLVGLVATFSSTAVVVKLLDRAGELEATRGRLAIGVLLVQDVLVVAVLTVLSGLAIPDVAGTVGGGASVPRGLGVAVLGIVVLSAGAALAARWILKAAVRWLAVTPDGLFIVGLAWAFAFMIVAEAFHLSVELGAFIAGVALAQVPHATELRRWAHPLVDFFLAVFFVSLGAGMEFGALASTWPAAVAVSVFVLAVKPLVVAVLTGVLGQPRRTALLTGLTLGQISEFAFLLPALGVGAGLVSPDFQGFVALVGLVTIGGSTVMVALGDRIVVGLDHVGVLGLLPGGEGEERPQPPLEGHVVVIGMNTLGRRLVEGFEALGETVLAVDSDPGKLEGIGTRGLVGDITLTTVVEEASLARARLVVSALQIEDVNSLIAYRCRRLGVPTSIHAFDPSVSDELLELGADHLMMSKHDGIQMVEAAFRRLGVIG